MGRVKQQMLDNEQNQQMEDFLQQLDEREELSSAVGGIYKQIKGKGFNSLSDLQKETLEKFSENYGRQNVCKVCDNGNVSSLIDYIDVADNGICPMCEYDRDKLMKD